MRVALMALTDDQGQQVRLGGRPVAWHQVQAALALGCERVVCLSESPGSTLAAIQREVEGRGAKFSAVANSRALSGLINTADTLFVFAPGILPDSEWLAQALGARAGIACLPAAGAVERGFERIDRDRAWGGVLSTRGDAVEALSLLPADADPIAGLLRVALQRGARCVEIPALWLDDGRWALLGDPAAARRVETGWQSRYMPAPSLGWPGEYLSHKLAMLGLPRLAENPAIAPGFAVAGVALAAGGGVAGYSGMTVPGLAMIAIGALVSSFGHRLRSLARAGAGEKAGTLLPMVRDAVVDLSLVAVAASPQQFAGWHAPFAALVLVAAMRLSQEETAPRFLRPVGDRILAISVVAIAAAAGLFLPAVAGIALGGLAARIFWPASTKLTQV